jgi:hypothetical protein
MPYLQVSHSWLHSIQVEDGEEASSPIAWIFLLHRIAFTSRVVRSDAGVLSEAV